MSKLRVGLASAALGMGLVAATVTPAHAAANDANIKNSPGSNTSFRACKDWSGTKADPGCKSGTAWVTLSPGEDTRSNGWADADGYELKSGCTDNYGNRGPKQIKVSGFFGMTKTRLVKC